MRWTQRGEQICCAMLRLRFWGGSRSLMTWNGMWPARSLWVVWVIVVQLRWVMRAVRVLLPSALPQLHLRPHLVHLLLPVAVVLLLPLLVMMQPVTPCMLSAPTVILPSSSRTMPPQRQLRFTWPPLLWMVGTAQGMLRRVTRTSLAVDGCVMYCWKGTIQGDGQRRRGLPSHPRLRLLKLLRTLMPSMMPSSTPWKRKRRLPRTLPAHPSASLPTEMVSQGRVWANAEHLPLLLVRQVLQPSLWWGPRCISVGCRSGRPSGIRYATHNPPRVEVVTHAIAPTPPSVPQTYIRHRQRPQPATERRLHHPDPPSPSSRASLPAVHSPVRPARSINSITRMCSNRWSRWRSRGGPSGCLLAFVHDRC